MFKSALIAFFGVGFCICAPPKDKPSALDQSTKNDISLPEQWNGSIFDHMSENKRVTCAYSTIFSESEYAKDCKRMKFPKSDFSLDDPEEFLCVGIYDRIARICYADSLLKVRSKSLIPKTSKDFDVQIKEEIFKKNGKVNPIKFCESWKIDYPVRYDGIKKWIDLLNGALLDNIKCVKICTNAQSDFKPVCAVLNAMDIIADDTFKEINASKDEAPKETIKKIVEKTDAPAVVVEHKEVLKVAPVSEDVVESAKEETVTEHPTSIKIKDIEKIVTADAPKNAPVNPPQQQESVPQNPAPPVNKNVVIAPASLPEETEKTEKEKKIKEPEVAVVPKVLEPKPQTDDNSAIDKKPEDQPSAQETPNVANDGGISHEDAGQGDILENEGQISQHTQDQENLDAGEEINEIHQAQVPLSEDAEESPPMPSDKREYIPRLPGIRNDDDTHFFGYFTVIGVICIAGYVGYHNKQKILAMLVEGRRSRGGRGRRRPSTANYRKLDCTLEEAVTSQCNSNVTHVIY